MDRRISESSVLLRGHLLVQPADRWRWGSTVITISLSLSHFLVTSSPSSPPSQILSDFQGDMIDSLRIILLLESQDPPVLLLLLLLWHWLLFQLEELGVGQGGSLNPVSEGVQSQYLSSILRRKIVDKLFDMGVGGRPSHQSQPCGGMVGVVCCCSVAHIEGIVWNTFNKIIKIKNWDPT